MGKTSLLLIIMLIASTIPFAFAHPDTIGASINTLDGKVSDSQIIGITQEKEENIESEFLTKEWFFQNFILLLGGIITLTMGVVVVIAYSEETSFRKIIKKY